jgi:hypothetical protein
MRQQLSKIRTHVERAASYGFGFSAVYRLREGITKTVAWFQAHRQSLREVTFAGRQAMV